MRRNWRSLAQPLKKNGYGRYLLQLLGKQGVLMMSVKAGDADACNRSPQC